MFKLIKRLLPVTIKQYVKRNFLYHPLLYCPICEHFSRTFSSFGLTPRPNAQCPVCGGLERHRLVWLFLKQSTDLFDSRPKRMLHFAPESCISERLSKLINLEYLTADLYTPSAREKVDITNIQYPDESYDIIYCSHVLEHVLDDRKAMRECWRVLRRKGWALFLVPLTRSPTFEDPSIIDPEERERLFGQSDHIRRYGPDFVGRLKEAGFEVKSYSPTDVAGDKAAHYAIPANEGPLFFCVKN